MRDCLGQTVCQSTAPLGKCMDYVQDDLQLMAAELEKWRSELIRQKALLSTERSSTDAALGPLRSRLRSLHEGLEDKRQKIASSEGAIAIGNERISRILGNMGRR